MKFVMDHIGLVAIAVLSGGMLFWPMLQRRDAAVTPHEAVMLINHTQALVLDVRENAEFAMGHIVDARHIPLNQLEGRLSELQKWKEKPIVVNCQGGKRSARACAVLRKNGFTNVSNLTGGMTAWQSAKLPVSKD